MDLVTTALVAALTNFADQTVRDGYAALKARISRKFGSASPVSIAVEELEQMPGSMRCRTLVQEELGTLGADRDGPGTHGSGEGESPL